MLFVEYKLNLPSASTQKKCTEVTVLSVQHDKPMRGHIVDNQNWNVLGCDPNAGL